MVSAGSPTARRGARAPARPELPRRPEPARRDRPRLGRRRRGRRAWRSEVGGGAERAAGAARRAPARCRDRPAARAAARRGRGGPASVEVVWGDAMKVDLAALDPAPTAVVSNLPYSVATPLILRTIEELPSVATWTVMVQREIADRLRAAPGQPHLRLAERARPARLRGRAWCAPSTARSSIRRRGSTRRCCASSAAAPRRRRPLRPWSAPPSPTGASRWPARWSTPRRAAGRGRWRRSRRSGLPRRGAGARGVAVAERLRPARRRRWPR